jgi:magnesium transporter
VLINCVAYRDGVKVRDLQPAEIPDWVGHDGAFVWVALKDPDSAELHAVADRFDLHPLAVEDVLCGHQRPKVEEYQDSLFAVLKLIDVVEGDLRFGEVCIFVGRWYVLSVRRGSDAGFLGVRARAEREPDLLKFGASFVFYALIDAVVDRYEPAVAVCESELEKIEEQIFQREHARDNVERLYELKRKVTAIRRAVVPLMDGVGKLFGGRVPPQCALTQDYFRDVYDHLYRVNATLHAVQDTISTAMQVNLSMVTIDQSEIAKRLTGWAAIFAVATAFFGVWGMNFEHMPELKWTYGYPIALGVVTAACGAMYAWFRRKGWI